MAGEHDMNMADDLATVDHPRSRYKRKGASEASHQENHACEEGKQENYMKAMKARQLAAKDKSVVINALGELVRNFQRAFDLAARTLSGMLTGPISAQ